LKKYRHIFVGRKAKKIFKEVFLQKKDRCFFTKQKKDREKVKHTRKILENIHLKFMDLLQKEKKMCCILRRGSFFLNWMVFKKFFWMLVEFTAAFCSSCWAVVVTFHLTNHHHG
jgi:hypothetical protein